MCCNRLTIQVLILIQTKIELLFHMQHSLNQDLTSVPKEAVNNTRNWELSKMCSRNIKISVVLFLVLIPLITALPHNNHNLSKRSNFFDLECKGIFNKTMFFRLDRICEDCYQLFRETSIHRLCKKNCFDSKWFGECLKVLLIPSEEISKLQHFIKVINGSPISFPQSVPT